MSTPVPQGPEPGKLTRGTIEYVITCASCEEHEVYHWHNFEGATEVFVRAGWQQLKRPRRWVCPKCGPKVEVGR